MVKISAISKKAAAEELAKKRVKGQWATIVEQVQKSGEPVKVEEISRGQVAAIYRTASAAGLKLRANYKEGYVILDAPEVAPKAVKKA